MTTTRNAEASSSRHTLLARREDLTSSLTDSPYDPVAYLERAEVYAALAYPDLSAGDAYRALLLADEVQNEGAEFHDDAREALEAYAELGVPSVLELEPGLDDLALDNDSDAEADADLSPAVARLARLASRRAYQLLAAGLLDTGCLRSAYSFVQRGLEATPTDSALRATEARLKGAAEKRLNRVIDNLADVTLPEWGSARREIYPWNEHEPDRYAASSLAEVNKGLSAVAPKLAIQAVALPALDGEGTSIQLGLFATDDIAPGELVLDEYSLVTASSRQKAMVCDACSVDLLSLDGQPLNCEECYDTVFCSDFCHDAAMERYHPAVCDKDVDAIAKDPAAGQEDETLHLLLLGRVLAIAAHEEIHPLQVREIKYIWGALAPAPADGEEAAPPALPFSFKFNIETPLHILEKMDIDVWTELEAYDLWVLNTVYAKQRGTASARQNKYDGKSDVAAVHPYWCLANHDCDPNITWEWDGRIRYKARETRVVGGLPGGVSKGDELLSHYCDVNLPVKERREWAKNTLGGWCRCARCQREAGEAAA
ncbi:hypothetical protein Q8F55_008160 [Vanrija albida]|uniref:SET domain-containing protein n=1 Tax=Vanrija albida TaxID=181172 RepID=A0ABR3PVH1_9TREE